MDGQNVMSVSSKLLIDIETYDDCVPGIPVYQMLRKSQIEALPSREIPVPNNVCVCL